MRRLLPVRVLLVAPPKSHPLAGSFRATLERVARRDGVVLRDAASGPEREQHEDGSDGGPRITARLDEADGAPGYSLSIGDGATWAVPAEAFGQRLDGLERIQRLGSLLGAVLDLATSPDGRRHLAEDPAWATPGVTHALAGTAHLSVDALQDALTRRLVARAAALLAGELDEGRDWVIDDWALPPELSPTEIARALAAGRPPDVLRRDAASAAEALHAEVVASIDQALATHGLAALVPLQHAIARFSETVGAALAPAPAAPAAAAAEPEPSDLAVREAEARLAALPAHVPGATLLSVAWAAPMGALSGLAAGPALGAPVAGAGHALASLFGTAAFVALSAAARAYARLRRRMAGSALATARRDYDAARAQHDAEAQRALAPSIPRGAGTWFGAQLDAERARLAALERHVRALTRTSDAGAAGERPSSTPDAGDIAVDIVPARALLDHAPEPLVQRVRAELSGTWRDALPTLLDLRAAARRLVGTPSVAPWVERRDVARALLPRLAEALAALARDQDQLVPRGLAVRRLALLPEPFAGEPLDVRVDRILPSSGEAHLLVAWRAE